MKTITPTEILDYYDGVLVFLGNDLIGGNYIGMLMGSSNNITQYMVAGVTPDHLSDFRAGAIDLRTVLMEVPNGEWYIADVTGFPNTPFLLQPQSTPISSSKYLPKEGYTLEPPLEPPVNDLLYREALKQQKILFEISLEPDGFDISKGISSNMLAELLQRVQSLVKQSYIKALSGLGKSELRRVDRENSHVLNVLVPAAAGSFKVLMTAAKPSGFFGTAEISRALHRMHLIFSDSADPETAPEKLLVHRGRAVSSYVRLLKFLDKYSSSLYYSWADPTQQEVRRGGFDSHKIHVLSDILLKKEALLTETESITGEFYKVDTSTMKWGLRVDNTTIQGEVAKGGPSLNDLTTGKQYAFECEVQHLESTLGEEFTKYTLLRITDTE